MALCRRQQAVCNFMCRDALSSRELPRCQGLVSMLHSNNSQDQQTQSLLRIRTSRVIACLRASSGALALQAARTALEAGIDVLEVTMTTPEAVKVISSLVAEYPAALIGAGTVLSSEQAQLAQDAGAKFLLSPVMVKEIVESHAHGPVLFVPGAMTPTEVFAAHSYGARLVKLYPSTIAGGVKYVKALTRMLPHIPVVASQGISLDMVEAYVSHGATAVVLSDAIFDAQSMAKADMSRIKQQASCAAALCKSFSNN